MSLSLKTRWILLPLFLLAMLLGSFLPSQMTLKAQAASTTPIHIGDSWKGTFKGDNGSGNSSETLAIKSLQPDGSGNSVEITVESFNQKWDLFGNVGSESYIRFYCDTCIDQIISKWGKSPTDTYITYQGGGDPNGESVSGGVALEIKSGEIKGASGAPGNRSGEFDLTKVTPARKNLVVVVDGINSALNKTQAYARGKDGQDDKGFFATAGNVPGIIPFLQKNSATYKNARVIVYSYAGYHDNGQPNAYTCRDTFVNPLVKDAQRLADQINAALKNDPNQDITLLGHSQGGLVLLTYITALVANNGSVHGLPTGANLKYAATFDSPDGGVSDSSVYKGIVDSVFRNLPTVRCTSLKSTDKLVSFDNMQKLYQTAKDKKAVGASASIPSSLLGGNTTNTQDILKQAVSKLGMSFLAYANVNDLLWLPHACYSAINDFPSTAYIHDQGDNSKVYARGFVAGLIITCPLKVGLAQTNHSLVLNNTSVERGLLDFVTGKTPYHNA